MARRRRKRRASRKRKKVSRKRRKAVSPKLKAARTKFAKAVDKCIVVASKSRAGTRMKALGRCVKREI